MRLLIAIPMLVGLAVPLLAQVPSPSAVAVVNVGYRYERPQARVTPGQLVTLSVYGIARRLDAPVVARGLPLPTTLAGLSVMLESVGHTATPVPLLSVVQVNCAAPGLDPCPTLTHITIQVPTELRVPHPLELAPSPILSFVICDQGVSRSTAVSAVVVSDQVRVVDPCDLTRTDYATGGVACGPVVTHADGSPVTALAPARMGEVLVLYALGLGPTMPLVPSGQAAPTPPPTIPPMQFSLYFDWQPNAAPIRREPIVEAGIQPLFPPPDYIGLVAGHVGLYQVNFRVPPFSLLLTPCDGYSRSNLTVTLQGPISFDGAGICVVP